MRQAFAAELAELERRMIDRLSAAANTLETIAGAVRDATAYRVATIAKDGRELRDYARGIHSGLVVIAARQTPVAADLRLVMALIEVAHHTVLIANQFELISEQLSGTDPAIKDRLEAAEKLSRMCALASGQLRKAATAFRTRDLAAALELDRDDEATDRLNREIFEAAAGAELPTPQRELAFRQVLIARCLERIADNAVDVGEQAAFVMTADLRQFSDASQPRSRT